jgi:hypothetical protein
MAGMVESVESHSCEEWEADGWDQGEFGNPEEVERPLLEAAIKERLMKTKKTLMCSVVTVTFAVYNSVRLS